MRTVRNRGLTEDGTRLFDGVPKSYWLDLVSSTASRSGIVALEYRRHR